MRVFETATAGIADLLFKSPKGVTNAAQIEAFEDTWHWNEQAEPECDELLHQA